MNAEKEGTEACLTRDSLQSDKVALLGFSSLNTQLCNIYVFSELYSAHRKRPEVCPGQHDLSIAA